MLCMYASRAAQLVRRECGRGQVGLGIAGRGETRVMELYRKTLLLAQAVCMCGGPEHVACWNRSMLL